MVLAPLEAVTAPNIYVKEETTQVGGGKGLTVCVCKRPHKGELVTGQLSHNTLVTAHAYNGTWHTKKNRCAFAVPRGFFFYGVLRFSVRFELVRVGGLPIPVDKKKQYSSVGEAVLKQ